VRTRPAFTLIELLVVLAILSIVALFVSPKLVSRVNPERTRSFMLTLENQLTYLKDVTVLKRQFILFNFDLDERRYSFTLSEEGNETGHNSDRRLTGAPFPEHMEVVEVRLIPGDTVHEGKVVIPFTPTGMLYSFTIRVREEGEQELLLRGDSIADRIEVVRVRGESVSPVR
jgi:prepilin-type N-terminal cleavage/methylation domain-containing protein